MKFILLTFGGTAYACWSLDYYGGPHWAWGLLTAPVCLVTYLVADEVSWRRAIRTIVAEFRRRGYWVGVERGRFGRVRAIYVRWHAPEAEGWTKRVWPLSDVRAAEDDLTIDTR